MVDLLVISYFPLLSRSLLLIVLPIIIVSLFFYFYLQSSLPQTTGALVFSKLKQKATITRDTLSIPYIEANNEADLWFTLGVAHAQDRLWQLELQRRISQGRLSEIFGQGSIEQDIWFRTLNLYGAAEQAWPALSSNAQQALIAYAQGINSYIEQQTVLPIEFTLLGVTPEPWEVVDSLAWIKVFAYSLSGDFRMEIRRLLAKQQLSTAQYLSLFPNDSSDITTTASIPYDSQTTSAFSHVLALQQQLEQQWQLGGQHVGSNAWLVKNNTNSWLANDPHLGLQQPSLWYPVSLKYPNWQIQGMSLVGLPVVIFGQNQHIAWGGTNMGADTQDLLVQTLHPEQPNQYKYNEQWHEFTFREEMIAVKADFPASLRAPFAPIQLIVRETLLGPVISDAYPQLQQPIVLQWTALAADDRSFQAFYDLQFAQDWPTFKQVLSQHTAPTLNMFYHDKQGNIGHLGIGKIPIRTQQQGKIPQYFPTNNWSAYIPAESMPQVFNPSTNYIINANNRIIDKDYPFFITDDWAEPARALRIEQQLQQLLPDLSMNTMTQLQGDQYDLSVQSLLPFLLTTPAETIQQQQALSYLQDWQGDTTSSNIAASIFFTWVHFLKIELLADQLQQQWQSPSVRSTMDWLVHSPSHQQLATILKNDTAQWCDSKYSVLQESCLDIMLISLEQTLHHLNKLLGNEMSEWTWGSLQQTTYRHQPFSQFKFLDQFFERNLGNGGSANSINVASSQYSDHEGFQQFFGPGFRQVIQFSATDTQHYFMNSTGQSGDPLSPHYDDMIAKFQQIEFHQFVAQPALLWPQLQLLPQESPQ